MTTVTANPFVTQAFDKLVAALEAFATGATLAEVTDDELRALEMRLATVCSILGGERFYRDDPYREEHGRGLDGDKDARF